MYYGTPSDSVPVVGKRDSTIYDQKLELIKGLKVPTAGFYHRILCNTD